MQTDSNYAFIDTQNLNLGIRDLGWKLDLRRFRNYLEDEFGVRKAYMFIGYMAEHGDLYKAFTDAGFNLMFKPLVQSQEGPVKGNIDADLVLQAMLDKDEYKKAVIVTSDGDFHNLVAHLYNTNRLETVISPNQYKCSSLLLKAAQEKIVFMNHLRGRLEYKHRRRSKKSDSSEGVDVSE